MHTNLNNLYSLAITCASNAMTSLVDKSGQPAIEHSMRIALSLSDIKDKIVGILHDVIEDTYITLDMLHGSFPEDIVNSVDHITKRDKETYMEFIKRCCEDDRARRVKYEDINDNNSPSRLIRLDPKKRIELRTKYAEALNYIDSYN